MNNNETTTSVPTYISLCSGYDGIGIGLKRAIPNLRTIAHCEIEAYAVANLIAKMEAGQMDEAPVFTDLKTFPYRELSGRVTVLSAGFPCQPFSSAGKRQATEDPRHLYPWIANGITAMRPRYVFLENVEGIISAKTGDGESVLKYVLGDLEERGYSCAWGIFSASEVGAPHQRKRVFILGYTKGIGFKNTKAINEWRECQSYDGSEIRNLSGTTSYPTLPKLGNTTRKGSLQCGEQREVGSESKATSGEGRKSASSFEHAMSAHHGGRTKYPARPHQQQHDWEEPRTIKPCVGGTANGTSYRVDRLRLLGNGVVPDTCELAFNTLIQQLR